MPLGNKRQLQARHQAVPDFILLCCVLSCAICQYGIVRIAIANAISGLRSLPGDEVKAHMQLAYELMRSMLKFASETAKGSCRLDLRQVLVIYDRLRFLGL